ncbi:MAG: hypothetical protein OER59_08945, partial [Desulfobulbaceae bacterium]|nr:hypothetical protein [Desulfobulbaceae bacterium]
KEGCSKENHREKGSPEEGCSKEDHREKGSSEKGCSKEDHREKGCSEEGCSKKGRTQENCCKGKGEIIPGNLALFLWQYDPFAPWAEHPAFIMIRLQ